MLTPVPAGVIAVNEALVHFALHTPMHHHAGNLGAAPVWHVAQRHGAPAFVVDPVGVDEFSPLARISGFAEIPRVSFVHALNIRACGRRLAREMGKPFAAPRAVVAHLGAGFSIAARPPALCRVTHLRTVRSETPKASATSAAVCPAATRAMICSRL
ncbi:MAG: hypothetical protein Kow0058_10360 [Roseovarius sp.]